MFNSHPRRPLLAALLVFLLACIAAATLIWHLDQRERQERRARVANLATARADVLQRIVERGLSASYALAALVRQGKGTIQNFDEVAGEMLPFYPAVSELALAPGGVIRDVVPLAGNEKALGFDLLKDPAQRKEALLARSTGKPILAGPLDLVQGGQGLVGRFPVFLDGAEGKPIFWGFALVVMRVPDVLETVDLAQLAERGFAYALWRIHPDTGQKQIIAASPNAALAEPIERALHVPNATWTLSLAPLAGWGNPLELALEAALGLLFSLLLAYLVKTLLELRAHRAGLEAQVGQRTAELREREARYRELFEANPQPMWVYDLDTLKFLAVNKAVVAHYGYSHEEFLAMSILDIRPTEDVPRLLQRVAQVQATDARNAGLWRHRKKDGSLIDVEITSHTLEFEGRRAQIIHIDDVTDRLEAERRLRESEARFRSLTEMASDFYWESDNEHRLTQLITGNKEDPALILPGGSPLGKPRWEVPYLTPDATGWEAHRAELDAHRPFRGFEYSRMAIDGVARHIEISGDPVFDASGAFLGYRGVGKDISERKAAEAKIARLSQLYAALGQCNQAIVRCASEDELFQQICRDTVRFGGMKTARISIADAATGKVRVAARFGQGEDELPDVEVSVDSNSPYGRGPTGTAIRENRPVWCQDFMNDPTTAPWRELGARLGWGAMVALPLRRNDIVVGAFVVFDGEVHAFDEPRRELLLEMAGDISYALDNFERESRRRQAEAALRESEARFRSLTEMSSDFYWETDAELRLTQRSSGSGRNALLALTHDDWVGRRRWEIPYLAPDEAGWQAHREVLDAHLPFRDFEFVRAGANGSARHMQIH
ncbi:MAG: PAS domain S-box protein, partial [Burkholderiales bacterium]|nr:PAS domain S-box protein [Burkholderiales bacterium]